MSKPGGLVVYADDVTVLDGSIHTIKNKQKLPQLLVRRLVWKYVLSKLSIWSCLKTSAQDKITT
jgi:hypothetical protein